MCGRYYFSVDLLDGIRELVEPGDWKLELGLLEKDMHPGDVAPVITIREDTARGNAEWENTEWKIQNGIMDPRPRYFLESGKCAGDLRRQAARDWYSTPGLSPCLKNGCSGTA